MPQIKIDVPGYINDLVNESEKGIYLETLKEVAFKRLSYNKRQLEDLKKKTALFEKKYHSSYEEFAANVPKTIEGHDDWIEWTFLVEAIKELSNKIEKLSFLMGK